MVKKERNVKRQTLVTQYILNKSNFDKFIMIR